MNNEIYSGLILPAREAEDGETPTRIVVTEEVNGYALWFLSFKEQKLLEFFRWHHTRDAAIEKAVQLTLPRRADAELARELKAKAEAS